MGFYDLDFTAGINKEDFTLVNTLHLILFRVLSAH